MCVCVCVCVFACVWVKLITNVDEESSEEHAEPTKVIMRQVPRSYKSNQIKSRSTLKYSTNRFEWSRVEW